MHSWTRRNLLRLAVALPAGGLFSRFKAIAVPNLNRVKITNIRAMAISNITGNCLIRIDTDSGLTGYRRSRRNRADVARSDCKDEASARWERSPHH